MKVLVVVDVQPNFLHGHDPGYLDKVVAVVREARAQNRLILLLEHNGAGQTHERIRGVLDGYEHHSYLTKWNWGGSLQVEIELTHRKIQPTGFEVCGLYSEQCVVSTTDGLLDRYVGVPVDIKAAACLNLQSMNWARYAQRNRGVSIN